MEVAAEAVEVVAEAVEVVAEAVEVVLLLALVNHETRIPSPAHRSATCNIATPISSSLPRGSSRSLGRDTSRVDLLDNVLWEPSTGQQSTRATGTSLRDNSLVGERPRKR